jgi:hypothetical protein
MVDMLLISGCGARARVLGCGKVEVVDNRSNPVAISLSSRFLHVGI